MKKFSTIVLPLAALLSLLLVCSSIFAADETHAAPTHCPFLANAPDQHIVVKGDTLWGISQMFLAHPWCWPQVWGMNRKEIKNPHWIYPGQIVYLDRVAGRLRLGTPIGDSGNVSVSGNVPDVHLSPQIRIERLASNAITTIPANIIEPFLSQPLILEEAELAGAPRIVSAEARHINISNSEKVYVMGDLHGLTDFQVYRPATPLLDPVTQQLLGYEYFYVGAVKLIKEGKTPDEAHSFFVLTTKEEITVGDRLLPTPAAEINNYVPHPPYQQVYGHIVSIYGGVLQAGQNQTVAINLGSKDGLDIGTVLKMFRLGETIVDKTHDKSLVKLPDEEYGTLFIYRVFHNVSYGLIMRITNSAQINDIVKNPE